MHRVAVRFGMIAAVALANPARAALPLAHNFLDVPTPRPTAIDFNASGNLPYGLALMRNDGPGGEIVSFNVPVPPSFQLTENNFPLGGNGFPLFNIRYDPGHDFYNSLAVQISSVPETSTWMMLLLGFAAVGFVMRHTPRYFGSPSAKPRLKRIGLALNLIG